MLWLVGEHEHRQSGEICKIICVEWPAVVIHSIRPISWALRLKICIWHLCCFFLIKPDSDSSASSSSASFPAIWILRIYYHNLIKTRQAMKKKKKKKAHFTPSLKPGLWLEGAQDANKEAGSPLPPALWRAGIQLTCAPRLGSFSHRRLYSVVRWWMEEWKGWLWWKWNKLRLRILSLYELAHLPGMHKGGCICTVLSCRDILPARPGALLKCRTWRKRSVHQQLSVLWVCPT